MLASAIEVYEVYRVLRRTFTVQQATDMVTALRRARIVSVDEPLAMSATEVALAHGLAMADSIIYATARRYDATLVTADRDFEDLLGVTVIR